MTKPLEFIDVDSYRRAVEYHKTIGQTTMIVGLRAMDMILNELETWRALDANNGKRASRARKNHVDRRPDTGETRQ